MITNLHHISVIVSCEQSVAFYKKIGFKEISRIEREYDTVVLMDGFNTRLELFIDPKHPQRTSSLENIGLRYISFRVDSIESEKQRLKDIEFGEINTDWNGIRYCFIRDYDGLSIQLHE